MNKFLKALLLLATAVVASTASAKTELIIKDQQLVGATGVIVNKKSYDVSFVDGSCISLFGGCQSSANFVFHNASDSIAASKALMNTVFTGTYDFLPSMTNGCLFSCSVLTPYATSGSNVSVARATNNILEILDNVDTITIRRNFNTHGQINDVYANWKVSAVPEPSSYAMLAAGLGLMGLIARRKRA